MSASKHARWHLWLALMPVLTAVLLQLFGADLQNRMRNALFDQYQRWQPRADLPAPVRIIDIDEASLQRLGQWPWPRSRLAQMVERLGASQVAAIGFDVMFSEPDRTSPKAIAGLCVDASSKLSQVSR